MISVNRNLAQTVLDRKEESIVLYSKTLGKVGVNGLWVIDPECHGLFLLMST